jgi:hypothetical protein
MASRWIALAGDLNVGERPSAGLPCQASAAATNTAHADIELVKTALISLVQVRATEVGEASSRYIADEADSASKLVAATGWTEV